MDLCIVLNVLILIPSIVVNAGSYTTIDVKVEGNQMAQSDVRRYTLYGHHSYLTRVSCTTFIDDDSTILPVNLSILKNDAVISTEVRTQARNISLTWSKTFDCSSRNSGSYVGMYVCRLAFSASYVVRDSKFEINSFNFSYLIESAFAITATTDTCVYESSVGNTGYYGETISFFCDGGYLEKDSHCLWLGKSRSDTILTVPLIYNHSESHGFHMPTCQNYRGEKNITIKPKLTLRLQPMNVTPSPNETEFICTSDPPRLMYWTIQTVNGDVMDFRTLLIRSFDANTNLTVIQLAGKTVLSLNDSTILAKGIKSVICSSYNTTANASVVSEIIFDGNYTELYRNISRIDVITDFQESDSEFNEDFPSSTEWQRISVSGYNRYPDTTESSMQNSQPSDNIPPRMEPRHEPTMNDIPNSTESHGISGSHHGSTQGLMSREQSAGIISELTGPQNEIQMDDDLNDTKPRGMISDEDTLTHRPSTRKYQTTDGTPKLAALSMRSEANNFPISTESHGVNFSDSDNGFTPKQQSYNLDQSTESIPTQNDRENNYPSNSLGLHGISSQSHYGYTETQTSSTTESSTEIIPNRRDHPKETERNYFGTSTKVPLSLEIVQGLVTSKKSPVLPISVTLSAIVLLTVVILVAVRLYRGSRHLVSDNLRQADVFVLGDQLPESSNVEDNPIYLSYSETDISSLTGNTRSNIYTTTNVYSEYLYDVTQYSLVQPQTNNYYYL